MICTTYGAFGLTCGRYFELAGATVLFLAWNPARELLSVYA